MKTLTPQDLIIGMECLVSSTKKTHIIGIHENGNIQIAQAIGNQDYWNVKYIQPILKPIEDINLHDLQQIGDTSFNLPYFNHWINKQPEGVSVYKIFRMIAEYGGTEALKYLFLNLDVHRWIEQGLAIKK